MDMGSVDSQGNRIEAKKTNTCRDLLKKGDLVMPKDDIGGGLIIGRTGYIPKNGRYVLGDHVYRLRFDDSLNGCFASYYINSNHIRKQILPKVTGSAQLGLNSKNVSDVNLKLPSHTEQELIGNYFEKLDNLITLHQRELLFLIKC